MTLADFTTPALLIPRLQGSDVASILQELTHALHRAGRLPEVLPFYHAALNREFLASTDLEPGIAFPHARVTGLKDVSFALGRMANPVAWGPRSVHRVNLVFLLAAPATEATQYLQVISGLARLAKDRSIVEKLHAAKDRFEIFDILREAPVRAQINSAQPIVNSQV